MTEPEAGQTGQTGAVSSTPPSEESVSPEAQSSVTENESRVQDLERQLEETKKRIGALAHANDERLRQKDAEWLKWSENYKAWAASQIEAAKAEAEESLLPKLDAEDQATYLKTSRQASAARRTQLAAEAEMMAQRRQQIDSAVDVAVQEALDKGVPRDALDTTSPESIKESAYKYLIDTAAEEKDKVARQMQEKIEKLEKDMEKKIAKVRDEAGITQATIAEGGAPPPEQDPQLKEIDEAIAALKQRSGKPGTSGQMIALIIMRNQRLAELAKK